MEYHGALPEQNDNVSQEHPLKDFLVILGWLVAIGALLFWLSGLLVDTVVDRISPETEASLHAMLPAPAAPTGTASPRQAHLQAMVDGLRTCAGLRTPATVTLYESEVPNAAVMPGGQIMVFSGLLGQVKSENGLAFVLAHEIGHLTQRDHLRALGRGIVLFGLTVLVTGGDSGLSELVAPVGALGHAKYSRTREAAADLAALRILQCRYGHAGGATEFFAAMKDKDGELFGLSHYAASHPAMQARIEALEGAIRAQGLPVRQVLPLPLPNSKP